MIEITNKIRAGYPVLWVKTHEENRFFIDFQNALKKHLSSLSIITWDITEGLHTDKAVEGSNDPSVALRWFKDLKSEDKVLILKDFHYYLKPQYRDFDIIIRLIRNNINYFKAVGKFIIILSPIVDLPVELEKDISVIDYKLPTEDDLKTILKLVAESAEIPYPEDDRDIINAALGLTFFEAENAFSISLIETKRFSPEIIRKEKSSIVRKTGFLDIVDVPETIDDIGGVENVKAWILSRKDCFTKEAKEFGIHTPPKGLLLVGTPGCGKSLIAKVIGKVWQRPLLRLDLGNIFGSYVGESEANMNTVLRTAEAVAPCVLWIDEIEKDLAGNKAGQEGHEVTRKVFKILLTWMQERKTDTFIVATANAVESIPPELLRAGRIDAIFWVDLPNEKQREEIIGIHLRKAKRDIKNYEIKKLLALSEDFSGAEIECWIKEALIHAYNKQHSDVLMEDFEEAVKEITPIAVLMADDIERARQWAKKRRCKEATATISADSDTNKIKRKIQKY